LAVDLGETNGLALIARTRRLGCIAFREAVIRAGRHCVQGEAIETGSTRFSACRPATIGEIPSGEVKPAGAARVEALAWGDPDTKRILGDGIAYDWAP
jgi:hypothetical protein